MHQRTPSTNRHHRVLPAAVLAGAALLASQGALAAEESTAYQKQFERWSQSIGELSRHGQAGQTGSEIELMRTWLGQGQALLASERFEKIDPLLERLAALAEFVEARHQRLDADAVARRAESKAGEAEGQAASAKRAADAAAKKKKDLEDRGL